MVNSLRNKKTRLCKSESFKYAMDKWDISLDNGCFVYMYHNALR